MIDSWRRRKIPLLSLTRMHSSRMRTTRSLPYRGGSPPDRDPLSTIPGRMSPDRDPPGQRAPGQILPTKQRPHWTETPRTETPLARQEVTSERDPPVDRQTLLKTLPCLKLRSRAVNNISDCFLPGKYVAIYSTSRQSGHYWYSHGRHNIYPNDWYGNL